MLTNWQKEKLFPWLQTAIWTLCNVLCVNVCVGIDGCFNLRFCDELAAGGGEYCTGDMCDSKHLVLVVHVTICCRGRVLHPVALALSVLATTVTDRLSLSISRPVPSFLSAVTPLPFGFFKWSLATSYLSHFRYYLQLQFFSSETVHLGTLNTSFIIKLFILPNIDFSFLICFHFSQSFPDNMTAKPFRNLIQQQQIFVKT